MSSILLDVHSLVKNFPGVQALKGVDFDLYSGEVHCLVGANGAGKSTLIKILSGIYTKDSGEIRYKGRVVEITSPKEARKLGIATVFQELDVVPYLSLAENIFLENYPRGFWGTVDYKRLYLEARDLLQSLGEEDISPSLLAAEASAALRQLVVIARALSLKAEVIIFDEPTAVLGIEEQQRLFKIIRELRSRNVGVVYISHRLEEVTELGDRVTVLRDGVKVSTRSIGEITLDRLIKDMTGESSFGEVAIAGTLSERTSNDGNGDVLSVVNLCSNHTKPRLSNISFTLKKGEIFGFFGFVGSGRSELVKCLIGYYPIASGKVLLGNRSLGSISTWHAVQLGMAMAPEERKTQGLFLDSSVSVNIMLPTLRDIAGIGFIKWKRVQDLSALSVRELDIKTPSLSQAVRYLSGGNQQKVVLARWLIRNCKILFLDEPTRGVDVVGKKEIIKLVRDKASEGVSFVVISSEVEELLSMCDRIGVLFRGRLMGIVSAKDCKVEELLKLASGLTINCRVESSLGRE